MELSFGELKVYVELPYTSLSMLIILVALTIASYIFMTRVRRGRIIRFANFEALRRIHGFKSTVPSPALLVVKIITVVLLFLVATESIQLNIVRPVPNTDFVIAIDASQTMLIPDYEPNRLEMAKSVAIKWLSKLPSATKIAVVKFSEKATPVVSLTTNQFEVKNGIERIEVDLNASGTAIGDALMLSSSILSSSPKQRFVILITDGKSNVGVNLTAAVKECREKNVVVYSIGIGSSEATKILFNELKEVMKKTGRHADIQFPELDERSLKFVSEKTGGKYYVVTNETFFEESFRDIIIRNERIPLNSDYYILLFISVILITELLIFSAFGAL